jgi:hypothetical protein
MVTQKPKLVLDTNICSKLCSSEYGYDAPAIKRRLGEQYDIVVSPRSLFEILQGTINAKKEEHLQSDKDKLFTLIGPKRPTFLEFPGHFALQTVLGVVPTVQALETETFARLVCIVIAAKNLHDLLESWVELPFDKTSRYGLDRSIVEGERADDQAAHRQWLGFAKTRPESFGTPEAWAYLIGTAHGVTLDHMQNTHLAKRLSAAYEYEKANFNVARDNPNLNIAKRDSDWGDFQQLFYLSDPLVHLLTEDERIRTTCQASEQSRRILLLKEA